MPDTTVVQVNVAGALTPSGPSNQSQFLVSPYRSQHVVSVEAPLSTLGAGGLLYALSSGVVANAKAPVQDIGTTTAAWALYNGNSVSDSPPYCLHVLEIGVHLASGTSDIGATVWVGMTSTIQGSALANATGIVGPKSLNSNSGARTSLATLAGAVTLAGAPAWHPIGALANHAAAATPGSGVVIDCEGAYVVKPGFALGITVLSGAGTTAKYAVSVKYAEYGTYNVL